MTPVDITSAALAPARLSRPRRHLAGRRRRPGRPCRRWTPEFIATTRIESLGVRSRSIFTARAHQVLVYTPAATAGRSDLRQATSRALHLRLTPE
jgi:hypothetical protein